MAKEVRPVEPIDLSSVANYCMVMAGFGMPGLMLFIVIAWLFVVLRRMLL